MGFRAGNAHVWFLSWAVSSLQSFNQVGIEHEFHVGTYAGCDENRDKSYRALPQAASHTCPCAVFVKGRVHGHGDKNNDDDNGDDR